MVAFPMGHRAFFECRGESCSCHLTVDLGQLSVQVSTNDYLGLRVLSDDALHQAGDCLSLFYYEALVTRLEVYIKDVDLLTA